MRDCSGAAYGWDAAAAVGGEPAAGEAMRVRAQTGADERRHAAAVKAASSMLVCQSGHEAGDCRGYIFRESGCGRKEKKPPESSCRSEDIVKCRDFDIIIS